MSVVINVTTGVKVFESTVISNKIANRIQSEYVITFTLTC